MQFASRFSLLLLAAAVFPAATSAQLNRLTPGELATKVFPATAEPRLFNGGSGFFLDVPAGGVEVEIELTSAPGDSNIDLYVRRAIDVQMADGEIVADFRSENPGGAERITISNLTSPALEAGQRYFVAVLAAANNPLTFGFVEVRVSFSPGAANLVTIASSDFESGAEQGWTRNYPEPLPQVPGSVTGAQTSTLAVRRGAPGETRHLELVSRGEDYFVASTAFLGKLSLLEPDARFEFDLAWRGEGFAAHDVEVRLLSGRSVFRWTSRVRPLSNFQRYVAPLDPSSWERLPGFTAEPFAEALRNILRIEIRANYGEDAPALLDNVRLLGRVRVPQAPAVSDFEAGFDGWTHNFPEIPYLQPRIPGATMGDRASGSLDNGFLWRQTDGNPGGFLLVRDREDVNRDYLVAPEKFLGNLEALGPDAAIEFDRRHESELGATTGVELRLIGFGGAYSWVGPLPGRQWTRYRAPLRPENWVAVAGSRTFSEVLRAVQRIEVSMDERRPGFEESGLDNFQLLAPETVVPRLEASPETLSFSAVQGQAAPEPRMLDLRANGQTVQWLAAVDAGAPWLMLQQSGGATPGQLGVAVNPAGLAPGLHEGRIVFASIGSTETAEVNVRLNVAPADSPLISSRGVVNSATFTANDQPGGELTGGMFVSIFGQRLSNQTAEAQTVPLPVELGGVSVTIGGLPAPMYYVSERQINAVVPQALTQQLEPGESVREADVIVSRDSRPGPAERVRLVAVRPRLFTQNREGTGPAAAFNVTSGGQVQLNTFDDAARPQQTITLFGTGFGPLQNPLPDGEASAGENRIAGSASVTVGGVDAAVSYAGLSPQTPHLYQLNVLIPGDAPLGCEVPVTAAIEGSETNTVTLAITADGSPCQ